MLNMMHDYPEQRADLSAVEHSVWLAMPEEEKPEGDEEELVLLERAFTAWCPAAECASPVFECSSPQGTPRKFEIEREFDIENPN